jgi:hypothetical protein
MKTMLRMLIGLAAAALLPAAVMAQKVSYDYDSAQDFTRLTRYTFKDSTKTGNPLVDERIADAIAAQLAARGLIRDDAHPDVYVVTRQAFDTRKEYTVYGNNGPYGWGWGNGWGWGYGWDWNPSYTSVYVKDVTVRTLTIDLQDAANEQLVWRGIGVATVHPTSKPSHVSRRVNHEVKEIFENYPPRGAVATLTTHRIQ